MTPKKNSASLVRKDMFWTDGGFNYNWKISFKINIAYKRIDWESVKEDYEDIKNECLESASHYIHKKFKISFILQY